MTDIDILKSIAENLSERKSSAAMNNYQVLLSLTVLISIVASFI